MYPNFFAVWRGRGKAGGNAKVPVVEPLNQRHGAPVMERIDARKALALELRNNCLDPHRGALLAHYRDGQFAVGGEEGQFREEVGHLPSSA